MTTHSSGLNLTTHRAPASVWDRRGWDGTRRELALTRWLVGLGGAALALQGMRQKSVSGSLLAGVGGSLAWWAMTGERAGWRRQDLVHDASADSFPASDAPSFTPTVGTGVRHGARAR